MKMGCFLAAVTLLAVAVLSPCLVTAEGIDAKDADGVLIYQVNPYGNEGVSLHNYGSADVDLKGWSVTDKEGTITFSSSKVLAPGKTLVLVSKTGTDAFANQKGTETVVYSESSAVSVSKNFALTDSGDDVYLLNAGVTVDAVCYGKVTISDTSQWTGASVTVTQGKWVQRIGASDTDTASDWRAYVYGQTLYSFDPGLKYDATVTPFTFPESGGVPVYRALSAATESIKIEIYMLQSKNVLGLLLEKAVQGVDVDILLEGNPLGYTDSLTDMAPYYRALVGSGADISFIGVGDTDRYSYDHAKFAVIDGDTVVVTSENWVTKNMNGTVRDTAYTTDNNGNRGWGAVIESEGYASYMAEVFGNDSSTEYGDVRSFTDLYPGTETKTAYYTAPTYTGTFTSYTAEVTPVLSNDTSYAAFEYYASNAQERLYCEQQSLGYSLGNGPLGLLSDAADRGVDTKLIVGNKATDDPEASIAEVNSKTKVKAAVMDKPYVHNKGVIADDLVWVSSVNWTSNSFGNNREVCAAIRSSEVADYFASYFEKDFQESYTFAGFRAQLGDTGEVVSGSEVTFTVTVEPAGDYSYVWDIGDGSAPVTTSTGSVTVMPAAGNHTLTVSITGSGGDTVTLTKDYTVVSAGDSSEEGDYSEYYDYLVLVVLIILILLGLLLKPKKGSKGKGRKKGKGSKKKR